MVGRNADGATVLYGDGSGTFADHVVIPDAAVRLESRDLDGDGREDLVYSRSDAPGQLGVWSRLALGDGTFGPANFVSTALQPYRIEFADWNHDGDADAVVTGALIGFGGQVLDQNITLLEGDGAGAFTVVEERSLPGFPIGMTLGDLWADGVVDCLVAIGGDVTRYELGTAGGFGPGFQFLPEGNYSMLIADVVGDELPDFVSVLGTQLRIFEGVAGQPFPAASTPFFLPTFVEGLDVHDLDADGNLDLVAWSTGSITSVLLGSGAPVVRTDPVLSNGLTFATDLALADVDGDGQVDAAVGGAWSQVLRGVPGGGFETWHTLSGVARDVAFADADDDGWPELVVASDDLVVHGNRDRAPDGVRVFGTGTPGCRGVQLASTNRPPDLGAADFATTCNRAPANALGLVAGSITPLEPGVPLLGVLAHASPTGPLFRLDVVQSDAEGRARFVETLPGDPGLAGAVYTRQFVWAWPAGDCAPSPLGWSTSRGVEVTLR